jgi:predicted nucleic acid-binding protein
MIVVADMGPLHYLVLIGAKHILPQLFTRVLTPPAVIAEMNHPDTPEPVRKWAASPPGWLEIKEPAHIEDIASLGKKGRRGVGEKAAIALAREEQSEVILMDDKTGRKEARKRSLEPLWMLSVLEDAAEQGLVTDLSQKLDHLERSTSFYVSTECKRIIEDMKRRDQERKKTPSDGSPAPDPPPE